MALTYSHTALYGGAITVSLPTGLIDASNLRQIPDHQEVFLREHTLTSVIFEINEYQTTQHLGTTANTSANAHAARTQTNQSAAIHHLNDTIQAPDYVIPGSLNTTTITMLKSSLAKFPAYQTSASIVTPEIDRRAARRTTLPIAWQSNPVQREYETKTQQLLVRLEEYGVDFCVRVNVPLKEFTGDENDDGAEKSAKMAAEGGQEVLWAEQVLDTIVKSLDVKDFALFGGS